MAAIDRIRHLIRVPPDFLDWGLFTFATGICILAGVYLSAPAWMVLPALFLFLFWMVRDYQPVYFLLLGTLPLSFEYSFSENLGTDLPSEPLMLLMAGVVILKAVWRPAEIRIHHVFDGLLLVHVSWIAATAVFAEIPLIAVKFLLAKTWYILAFYTLGRIMLNNPARWEKAVWFVLVPLVITHVIALIRFRTYGFAFADVNRVVTPFYRNHVTFAALAVVLLPYAWFLWQRLNGRLLLKVLVAGMVLVLLAGVQFSYTRAAYVALLGGVAAFFLIRWRLMKPAIGVALILAVTFLGSMIRDNRFLDFAPDYNKTVTHYEFSDLVNATYKLQDISTMERVYRWIAGFYMVGERPWTGFGPNNFYENYQSFTARAFRTYVSDNPERSGIHNYYLMTAVEQGIPGLLIYLGLILTVLLAGERVYHRTREPHRKALVLTALCSLVVIHLLQTMNDLVETDKVGPFFFLNMAAIVGVDLYNRGKALS